MITFSDNKLWPLLRRTWKIPLGRLLTLIFSSASPELKFVNCCIRWPWKLNISTVKRSLGWIGEKRIDKWSTAGLGKIWKYSSPSSALKLLSVSTLVGDCCRNTSVEVFWVKAFLSTFLMIWFWLAVFEFQVEKLGSGLYYIGYFKSFYCSKSLHLSGRNVNLRGWKTWDKY